MEKLVSQNRNNIESITCDTPYPKIGDIITITAVSSTASGQHYNDITTPLLSFDPGILEPFDVVSYLTGDGSTGELYLHNVTISSMQSNWTFKVVATGTTTLRGLIYDRSGSSYHYNSDSDSLTLDIDYDYGDAPGPTYPTLISSNRAGHIIPGIYLGGYIDDETDGQPNSTATGDDINPAGGLEDEDGVVDGLIIVYAGPKGSINNRNRIYPHEWVISPQERDGKIIYNYTVLPEYRHEPGDTTIGPFFHEFAHILGAVDLYDLDGVYGYRYDGQRSNGLGKWSLMSDGVWGKQNKLGDTPSHLDA